MQFKHPVRRPDHPMGYRVSTLQERLAKTQMDALSDWMRGQTITNENPDGSGEWVWYTWDVQRFFQIVPGKEIFD